MRSTAALAVTLLALALPMAAQEDAEAKQPDKRRVIACKPYGDTIQHSKAQNGWTLENAIVQASPRTAIIFFDKVGAHRGTTLRNVLIHVEPGKLELDRSYWAFRGYDMIDTLLDQVEITGFGPVTDRHDEGHAIYVNPAGNFTLLNSYIHNNGGQGIQLVNRPAETSMGKGPMPGTIRIEDTRFHENGFNPDRGAFQVSIFGTGQDVILRNVEIFAGLDETKWVKDQTGGAFLIEPEPFLPAYKKFPWWRPDDPAEDFVAPFTQGDVELTNVTIRHRNPNRPIAQIKGCRSLTVRGCTFEGLGEGAFVRVVLDSPEKPGRTSGRIVWEGNHGNAVIFHNGQRMGLACEDFVIEAKTEPDDR